MVKLVEVPVVRPAELVVEQVESENPQQKQEKEKTSHLCHILESYVRTSLVSRRSTNSY